MKNPMEPKNPLDVSEDAELQRVDQLMRELHREEPSVADLLRVRRNISTATAPPQDKDILTVEEVGKILRLSPRELDTVLPDLPAFELAGRIRIRRERLLEWIEEREKAYIQATVQDAVEKSLNIRLKEIVA